jgi:polysaccharide deacetylase family protein (PEP-CTERM system associated)
VRGRSYAHLDLQLTEMSEAMPTVQNGSILNAMTVDVEDYYQVSAFESVVRFEEWDRYESRVERNTNRILDLFDSRGINATFFVLGWVAERRPRFVRSIAERGHDVACHGYSHRCIYTQTPDQFRAETRRAKRILEDAVGKAVIGYRAASYSITHRSLWALRILQQEGFVYDSSIFPIYHDRYGIPGFPPFCRVLDEDDHAGLIEFPPSTVNLAGTRIPVGGGGYLRLFPYSWTRWAIRRLHRQEHQPAVVWIHPWEIDPDQPRIRGRALSRFRTYVNLARTEQRLVALLHDFRWGTMPAVLSEQGVLNDSAVQLAV